MPSDLTQLAIHVLDSLLLKVLVPHEDLFFGTCQYTIQPTRHREGENHVGILAPLEIVPKNLISNGPDKIDNLLDAVRQSTLLTWCFECPHGREDGLLRCEDYLI
jgi:hypothetical protein